MAEGRGRSATDGADAGSGDGAPAGAANPHEISPPDPADPVEAALVHESGGEDLAAKAAGGFVWALVGFALMQLGGFATYTIASRLLGSEGLGLVATFLTVFFYADVLLDVGMGATLIYEQEEGQSDRVRLAFTVNTMAAVVVAAAVFFGAPLLASFFSVQSEAWLFRLLALLVLTKGLNQIPDALLRREIDFKRRVRADLTRALSRFVIATVMLYAGYGVTAMVVGIVASEVLATIVTFWLVRFRPGFNFDRQIAVEMFRFGAAVFGSRLTGMLWLNGDYLVISNRFGGGSKQMGDYYTAFRLPELIIGSVYALFSSIAFPAYSAARESGPEKLRQASLRSLRLLTLFGFTAGIGLSLIASDFIPRWFGRDYLGAVVPMEIFGIAAGFAGIGFASGDLFSAVGKPRLGLYFNLAGAPILIGGFLLFVDHGVAAVAWVHVAVIVPYAIFRMWVANRLIGTTWPQNLAAVRAAAVATAGLVALALPLRLLMTPGLGRMALIVVAGAVGAVVGLAVGERSTFGELSNLARKALNR